MNDKEETCKKELSSTIVDITNESIAHDNTKSQRLKRLKWKVIMRRRSMLYCEKLLGEVKANLWN